MNRSARDVLVLGTALGALLVLRAGLAFVPNMAWWGLNLQRFLAPGVGWGLWALAAIALVPALGRAADRPLTALGQAIERRGPLVALATALLGGLLAWAFADRLLYVGDAALRLGAVILGENPETLSPQALPLDVWLHFTLPHQLVRSGMSAEHALRAIGALDAALLGAAAVAFARAVDTGPLGRVVALAGVLFGGYLCLFTGEGKAFAELCVCLVAFAACALRVVRDGRGLLGMGLALALAIALHRLAIAMLPAFALAWIAWLRGRAADGAWRRPGVLAAAAIPAVALVTTLPRIARTFAGYDVGKHVLNRDALAGRSVVQGWLEPLHLLDVVNLVLMLAPLVPVAVVAAIAMRRDARAPAERWLLPALWLPFAAVLLLTWPRQGLVRDWDVFAASGVALAIAAAATLADRAGREKRGLALALVLAAVVPSVQWVVHFHDPVAGSHRIEALLQEPPARAASDRAATWDFLGWRYDRAGDYAASAHAFRSASEIAPSPRFLTNWAMAETLRGNHADARELYARAAARDSNFTLAWFGLAVAALNTGRLDECERAVPHLLRLAPENPKTHEIVAALEQARGAPR